MRKNIQIGIIIIIITIIASTICYLALTPQYKEIQMSGYTLEVPNSNKEVQNNTVNYNTYTDNQNNITIKTWAYKDTNDTNGTTKASNEMRTQLGENMGTNTTYKNITLFNKSGTYTYYEADTNNSCMILLTGKDLNTIEHILETIEKPKINKDTQEYDMDSNGLILTNPDNTINNQTTTSTKKSTTKKSSTSKASSNKNNGYKWSAQYGDYIKEYTDSNGVQHIDSKKGYKSSYNPKTNEFKEQNYEKLL